eukprot:Colp12_sorted_trinity150504_noHs@24703
MSWVRDTDQQESLLPPMAENYRRTSTNVEASSPEFDVKRSRFPYCIVWTPLPFITWFLPFIGHMGIATSTGVIRDFAGPYYVSEDNMAFGKPTKYWRLDPKKVHSTTVSWDDGVAYGSGVYMGRMHNLFCDNCHSHVASCLNHMQYGKKTNWNMVILAILMVVYGRYVSFRAFLITWLPFCIMLTIGLIIYFYH